MLIHKGANINHQDELGRSPLHQAALCDNFEAAEMLIQNELINLEVICTIKCLF